MAHFINVGCPHVDDANPREKGGGPFWQLSNVIQCLDITSRWSGRRRILWSLPLPLPLPLALWRPLAAEWIPGSALSQGREPFALLTACLTTSLSGTTSSATP
jgi:hypothetical protein